MEKLTRESGVTVGSDYKKMLAILDHIFFDIFDSNDNCLAALLGAWSLDVMSDGAPADLGDYEIWLKCESENKDADVCTKILAFLNRFVETFGFDELNSTVEEVKKLPDTQIKTLTENIK